MSKLSALKSKALGVACAAGVEDPDEYADLLCEQAASVNDFLKHAGTPSEPCPPNPDPEASPEAQQAWVDAHALKCFALQANDRHKKQIAHHIKRQKRRDKKPIKEQDAEALAESLVREASTSDQASTAEALLKSRQTA